MSPDPQNLQAGAFAQFILDYEQLLTARSEIPDILDDMFSKSDAVVQKYIAAINRQLKSVDNAVLQHAESLAGALSPRFLQQLQQAGVLAPGVFSSIQQSLERLARAAVSPEAMALSTLLPESLRRLQQQISAFYASGLQGHPLFSQEQVKNAALIVSLTRQFSQEQAKILGQKQIFLQFLQGEIAAQRAISEELAKRQLQQAGAVQTPFGFVLPQTANQLRQLGLLTSAAKTEATGFAAALGGAAGAILAIVAAATSLRGVFSFLKRLGQDMFQQAVKFYDIIKNASVFLGGVSGGFQEGSRHLLTLVRYAREAKAPLSDILDSARQLAPVIAAAGQGMEALPYYLDVARKLAVLNLGPTGGVGGAIFSISEMLSGDVRSIQRRFRINTDVIQQIAREQGITMIEALDKFLTENLGITQEVVQQSMETIGTSFRRMTDSLGFMLGTAFRPIAEGFIMPTMDVISDVSTTIGETTHQLDLAGVTLWDFLETMLRVELSAQGILDAFRDVVRLSGLLSGVDLAVARITGGPHEGPSFGIPDFGVRLRYVVGSILGEVITVVVFWLRTLGVALWGMASAAMYATTSVQLAIAELFRVPQEYLTSFITVQHRRLMVLHAAMTYLTNLSSEASKAQKQFEAWNKAYLDALRQQTEIDGGGPPEIEPELSDELRAWIEFSRDVERLQQDYRERLLNLERDYNERLEEEARAHQRRLEELDQDHFRRRAELEQDFNERYLALLEGREGRVASILQRVEIERKYALEDLQQEIEELTAEHYDRLRELFKDYRRSVQEAAARLDAIAVVDAQRSYKERVREENKRYKEQLENLQRRFDAEWTITSREFQRRLAIAREYDLKQAEQLKQQFEERLRQEDLRWQEQRQKLNEQYNERLSDLRRQYEKERTAAEKYYRDRLEDMNRQFTEEILRLEGHLAQQYALYDRGLRQVEELLEQWWKEHAHLYIPPYYSEKKDTSSHIPIPKGAFQYGGLVPSTGTYLLHSGEVVIPADVVSSLRRASYTRLADLTWTGNVILNGTQLSQEDVTLAVQKALVDAFKELAY